ncbi:MAG: periplasmic heavy metal sensor [Ignavibacterium sp.]|nr:periplasmic heavy metal sensor [Ignavibacterium sp.]
MKNTLIGLLSLLIVFALFNDADAQKRRNMSENFTRMHENLNLTEQQTSKLEDLRIKHQEQMIDLRAELDKARLENQKLRRSTNLSRSEFINQTKKMSSIKNKMAEARANHLMDVYETLNDEQRKTWNDMKWDRPKFRDGDKRGSYRKSPGERGRRFE